MGVLFAGCDSASSSWKAYGSVGSISIVYAVHQEGCE